MTKKLIYTKLSLNRVSETLLSFGFGDVYCTMFKVLGEQQYTEHDQSADIHVFRDISGSFEYENRLNS